MAYIGSIPADRGTGSRVRDEFTADGTQICFALSTQVPGSFESNVIAIVDNVIQQPVSAYTIVDTITITLSALSGTFTLNETITGGTSGATAKVIRVTTGSIVVRVITGTFATSETITGGTSSATATTSVLSTNVGQGINFTGTPTNGSVIYILHQAQATYNLTPAAGSVTPESLSENLRSFTVDTFTATSGQTAFTLTQAPISAKSVLVFVDGVMQTVTSHYTLSGTTLTMGSGLTTGQTLTVVHLGFSTVSRTAFADGTVTTSMLADGSITSAKIADGTVIAADVADGAITTNKIATGAITSAKIADGSIVTIDIADAAVTLAKLSATGTKDATTFLRGDNTFSVVSVTPTAVSDQSNTSTGYFSVPSGTTAQRPGTPVNGMTRYNTTIPAYEAYINGNWTTISTGTYSANVLILAGGGGGGTHQAGGGGAGGLLYYGTETPKIANGNQLSFTPGTSFTVTIGGGGAGDQGSTATTGTSGSNTVFGSYTAIGGGAGASSDGSNGGANYTGIAGGSGGGGSRGPGNSTTSGGAGTSGQGNNGGGGANNTGSAWYLGGGGGGAGAVGTSGSSSGVRPDGGAGLAYTISGASLYYAGGGGGGANGSGQSSGAGGSGVGGGGGAESGASSTAGSGGSNGGNATANRGSGGGGSAGSGAGTNIGGNGSGGVVIISYSGSQKGTGGTITSAGGNTIHTFTTSGTFTA